MHKPGSDIVAHWPAAAYSLSRGGADAGCPHDDRWHYYRAVLLEEKGEYSQAISVDLIQMSDKTSKEWLRRKVNNTSLEKHHAVGLSWSLAIRSGETHHA